MPAESPGERDLLERIVHEDPEARAARSAYERWVTAQRLWAAIDGAGITDNGGRARFIAGRLWPDMPGSWVEAFVEAARLRELDGRLIRRPERCEDVVGPRLAPLMRKHGYRTTTEAHSLAPQPPGHPLQRTLSSPEMRRGPRRYDVRD